MSGMEARLRSDVLGAVLAGGAATRMGGDKAGALVGGEPLVSFAIGALSSRLGEVVVVAKPDTRLPELPGGVRRLDEPESPRHPATGIVAALAAADGRPVLVLPCDLPHADGGLVDALLEEPAGGSNVVAGVAAGRVQPLIARYEPSALTQLEGFDPELPMTRLAIGLGASLVAVDERAAQGVNDPAGLEGLSRR